MTRPPSGEQFEIRHEDQRVTVVELGGGIRRYDVGSRNVLDPYPVEAMCDGAHGAVLIPWPNRLAGGRYEFDGTAYQLAHTEPERHGAIHGLLRWQPWEAREHGPERVVMRTAVYPQPGYPFALEAAVAYELSADGLLVGTSVRNVGERPCPFGCGQHPYLSPGPTLLDDCRLEFGAATRLLTDERQIPVGREPVAGTPFDFCAERSIGDLVIDSGFTDLTRSSTGRAEVALTGADGGRVTLWADERYGFLQLYTGDTLAPSRRRRGLAAEPMTCPANAFATGEALLRLEPGEEFAGTWGVTLR